MPYMVLYTGDIKPKLALVIKDLYDIDMKSVNDSIYILKSLQNKSTGDWGDNAPISELEINVKDGYYLIIMVLRDNQIIILALRQILVLM